MRAQTSINHNRMGGSSQIGVRRSHGRGQLDLSLPEALGRALTIGTLHLLFRQLFRPNCAIHDAAAELSTRTSYS